MATIKCLIQSKKQNANIYVRLSIDRNNVYKRKTGYMVNPDNWSQKKGLPKLNDESLKKLKTDLDDLCTKIEQNYNAAIAQRTEINGNWLQNAIDTILNKKKKTDLDRLTNYFQYYIDNLPHKVDSKGRKGVTRSTLTKYNTILIKIKDFEKHLKKNFYVKDVDLKFRLEIIKYFTEIEHLGTNTTGRYIKFIKTVCYDARKYGIETNHQLDLIKGYTEKVPKIFLAFGELEIIEQKKYSRPALENAKDWLIIGCYIGQRVSDLLILTKENINVRNGFELIELTQKKTGKLVAIPLHPKVKEILGKRDGNFPEKISSQRFNEYIKDVAKLAKIKQLVEGSCLDKETNRKKQGTFEKWELVTSHICRRSFASNFYGEIPTSLLINITAHATEKQFLEYIGKSANDYAIQLAEYWNKQAQTANEKSQMTVNKMPNKLESE